MAGTMSENEALKRLTDIAIFLQKLIECPVCLEAVSPPVRQCSSGHVTCSACARRLRECALCKEPLLKKNPIFVNSLLDALPRFCRYSEQGCEEVCVTGDGHEDFCILRRISCREPQCDAKVVLCTMRQHYQKSHPNRFLIDQMAIDMIWTSFSVNQDQNHDIPVFFDENFFYLKKNYITRENQVKFSLEAFLQGKPDREISYFMRMRYSKDNFEFSKTIKPIMMKGECDKDGLETICEVTQDVEDFCMRVSRASLLRVMKKGEIMCSLKFFKS